MTTTATTTTALGPPASAGRRGVASRDEGDLARRLEHHRVELTAFCADRLRSRAEAEDAVQETLIRAWSGYDRFRGESSLRTWLYRIAGNVCIDVLRSPQRRALPMDLGAAPGSDRGRLAAAVGPRGSRPLRDAGLPSEPHQAVTPPTPSRHATRSAGLRQAAAPSAPTTGGPGVVRGAAVAGDRGGRSAGHDRRVGHERPAAGRARLATMEASGPGRAVGDRAISNDLLALYVDAFDGCDVGSLVSLLRRAAAGGPADTGIRVG